MLEALARGREAEDVLPVRVAGGINDDDGWADDLLIVVKKERCSR
jgi:hypothetical protein